jgi:vacuolar-type H+-ATPase subunit H
MTPERAADMPTDPLTPLTTALLQRAQQSADDLLARTDADAEQALARARAEADRVLAEARAKGRADAAEVLAAERARAEREARAVVLAAQQSAHEALRQAARAQVTALVDDPAYPALLEALRARAERELGPGSRIEELPDGGIRASLGDRHLELSLAGLADDLVEELGDSLEELWAP